MSTTTQPRHHVHLVLCLHDGSDGNQHSPWQEAGIEHYAEAPASTHGHSWDLYRWGAEDDEFALLDSGVALHAVLQAARVLGVARLWVGPGRDERTGFVLDVASLRVSDVSGVGATDAVARMALRGAAQ